MVQSAFARPRKRRQCDTEEKGDTSALSRGVLEAITSRKSENRACRVPLAAATNRYTAVCDDDGRRSASFSSLTVFSYNAFIGSSRWRRRRTLTNDVGVVLAIIVRAALWMGVVAVVRRPGGS